MSKVNTEEETSKKGISGVKGAFARLAAALQEIKRLQNM